MNQRVLQTGVLIVGAGPSGLGVSAALQRAGVIDQMVIDAREIGASFKNWPRGMSLLTPSFHSNPFGLTDLNAI
ncbi:MAG: NAD(P)-binding domain-containing protein, partial [Verrucomicrobiota bacterium]